MSVHKTALRKVEGEALLHTVARLLVFMAFPDPKASPLLASVR